MAWIPGDGIPVEHVEDRKVAGADDEPPAVDYGPELQRIGRLDDVVAAEAERLPQKQARAIKLGRRTAGFLKLEVLDRAADPVQPGKRSLGNDLGNEVGFAAPPELQAEEQGESTVKLRSAVGSSE